MRRSLLLGFACGASIGLHAQITYPTVDTYTGTTSAGLLDGSLATAEFDGPYGVCYDPGSGAIYVADGFNHCIRRLQNGLAITVAGNGIAGDADGIGSNARFDTPTGVYFKNGFLYICDNFNNKIKRMDASYNVVTIAGSGVWGFADGPVATAAFKEPKSLVVDDLGVIYVADYENHRIRKIDGGMVTTVAGNGSAGDGLGPALSISLHRPRDLCLDAAGNVYFVDLMNHRVKVLTTLGYVELVAGSGSPGSADGAGLAASFNTPVAIDWEGPGTLIVLDAVNAKLRRVTTAGVVTTVAGSGIDGYLDGPSASASFDLPQDICFNGAGDLFVGDRNNNAIRVLQKYSQEAIAEINDAEFPIHPNPTADLVHIDISSIADPLTGLMVYDERGALVLSLEEQQMVGHGQGMITINAEHWAAGRYAVLVSTRGRIYRSSFIR